MSLASNVESLIRRKLTADEAMRMSDFQSLFNIANDDPIIVVLAMMAMNQIAADDLPEQLRKHAIETIELHRIVLQEQTLLISKELITTIAGKVKIAGLGVQAALVRYAGFFVAGVIVGMLIMRYVNLHS